ncbi:hypothetical protein A3K63_03330 [Candidatus Micrarchaeota archaeon RBG_16_49_10]|nr:MAG: hypothetical protein A3K63_03330 [Candidatus Micrarchaeota archaeon RBG_16_49_10]
MLRREEKKYLLKLARETLERHFEGKGDLIPKSMPFKNLEKKAGTFVTLEEEGELRGCIGHIIPVNPIYKDVAENALNAAFQDPRFVPVVKEELGKISIEVSVLTVPKTLEHKSAEDLLSKLRPGVDGVIIEFEGRSATFLPQVWEQLKDKKEFLRHLCMKAWLPQDSWKAGDCKIEVYQVECFSESI